MRRLLQAKLVAPGAPAGRIDELSATGELDLTRSPC